MFNKSLLYACQCSLPLVTLSITEVDKETGNDGLGTTGEGAHYNVHKEDSQATSSGTLKEVAVCHNFKETDEAAGSDTLEKGDEVAGSDTLKEADEAAGSNILEEANGAAGSDTLEEANEAAGSDTLEEANEATGFDTLQ